MSHISAPPGTLLTSDEESVIESIADGTYFYYNVTPTGDVDGVNTDFELPAAPNPTGSLQISIQGQLQVQGTEYTLSGTTISFTTAPWSGATILAHTFTVSPV